MVFVRNYRIRFLAVFLSALLAWMLAGNALHRHLAAQNTSVQLEESAELLMWRLEKAVDFVVIAGTELLVQGQTECNTETGDILRSLVLQTATISDIYLVTPTDTCSSFGDLSADLPSYQERVAWTEALNPAYRIGRIATTQGNSTIGVSWGLGSNVELVTAVSVDATLFDTLPSDLRSHGNVYLSVDDQVLGSFIGDNTEGADTSGWPVFSALGVRYPLSIGIQIEPRALSAWRRDLLPTLLVGWTVVGILAALTAATAAIRGHNKDLENVVRALTNQEIKPYFQPIVDTLTGSVVGCEALARWITPDGTPNPPSRFIPFVEQFGLNDELLSVMVEQTARDLRYVIVERPDFYVSFNVTPDQLSKSDFSEFLITLARKNLIPPAQICIEITERQVIASPDAAARTTEKLKAAGFRVAIDDAGTGHNGMASMQKLRVDTIKIDKFFIDHITDDPRSRVMVDMFISVAARYGMTTVAEGVEDTQQLTALKVAGVDYVQGYLFSLPCDAATFKESLNKSAEHYSDIAASAREPVHQTEDTAASSMRQDTNALPSMALSDTGYEDEEMARLAALYRYQLLDTEPEEAFDRIPRIIRNALQAPFAAIALIDKDRRWFKAVAGGQRGELHRSQSFCNHTIQCSEPTIVPDTLCDDRFRENVLVVGAPHIRAYLGVPLETLDGYRIGSLCCVDKEPRTFTDTEVQLVKDLSSIVMEQIELRTLTLFDTLTSAYSRRGFRSETERRLAEVQHRNYPFSILMLDIDHFKQINDGYGHKVGDEVLANICERIGAALGENCIIGRMGGEEFAVALVDVSPQKALEAAENIRHEIGGTPFQTSRGAIPVTVSIGTASADPNIEDIDLLLDQADWALYQAKGQGRNRVNAYVPTAA